MIEVERKANITSFNIEKLKNKLLKFNSSPKNLSYFDTYFSAKEKRLLIEEKELRVRIIRENKKIIEQLLTYKGSPIDKNSKSKEELEVLIDNAENMIEIQKALGFKIHIQFEKHCENFKFQYQNHNLLVSLVSFSGKKEKFIEIETLIQNKNAFAETLKIIDNFCYKLGITEKYFTNQYYTDFLR